MHAHPSPGTQISALLADGKALARQNRRAEAQARFARVLSHDPNHVEALLWLAAIEHEARQSVRYLNRVLEISPGNPRAVAGLRWAAKQLRSKPQTVPERVALPGPVEPELPVIDGLLLSSIVLMCIAACVILFIVAWDAPGAVRAAYMPAPTHTVSAALTATPEPTHTPVPTATATSTHTPTPTETPDPSARDRAGRKAHRAGSLRTEPHCLRGRHRGPERAGLDRHRSLPHTPWGVQDHPQGAIASHVRPRLLSPQRGMGLLLSRRLCHPWHLLAQQLRPTDEPRLRQHDQ
jgi:hypothetical protein